MYTITIFSTNSQHTITAGTPEQVVELLSGIHRGGVFSTVDATHRILPGHLEEWAVEPALPIEYAEQLV